MDIVDAIRTRKSIRGFKPDPVPKEILREIIKIAGCAPSAMNTQPWEFTVITGNVLENVSRTNVEKLNSGEKPHPDHVAAKWPDDSIYRHRQVELAKRIFQLMGIQREDKEKRARWMERGFRYFDAPAAIIISVDKALSEAGPLLDIGAVMQTICLAALDYGLGTCIEDQGIMYPGVLREFTGIPESKRIIIAIAIGYPDGDFPVNKMESTREPVESTTTWCGFA
jgi:nitroreductase